VFCYRHPGRETGVSCQRCGRYICPECQLPNAVGYLCPEDGRVPVATKLKNDARPLLTISIIVLNVFLYLGQLSSGGTLTNTLLYVPLLTESQPWRMITAGFVHSEGSFMHIALNMYSLYILGSVLEPMLGRLRFFTLYLLSILGGSIAVLLLDSPISSVVGASGGVFGLMGAYFIILKSLGQSGGQITAIIALNLVFSFIGSNISWQAHLGGLVVGGLVAFAYAKTRQVYQKQKQQLYVAGIFVGLLAITVYGVAQLPMY
jgi:membrane associated rhomboid family serine protease